MKVQLLESCEYLEWPGEIELLEPGIKQHHDLLKASITKRDAFKSSE